MRIIYNFSRVSLSRLSLSSCFSLSLALIFGVHSVYDNRRNIDKMQRETVAATPAAALSLASKSKDNEAKALDKAIKGPPLASRSHTLQILVMLSLNSFLLFMCLYVLPAHLLWRKALKQHILAQEEIKLLGTNNNAASTGDSLLSESVAAANAASTSATKNILVAFQLLFKIPIKDTVGVSGIRRGYRSALAALVLSEGWFVARYKGWWEEAEAMERGDRDEVLKRRKVGIGARMEVSLSQKFASKRLVAKVCVSC